MNPPRERRVHCLTTFHDLLQFHLQFMDFSDDRLTGHFAVLCAMNGQGAIAHNSEIIILHENNLIGMFNDSTRRRTNDS